MGWSAFVETEFGERFRLILPNGSTGGKSLLGFIQIAESGCENDLIPIEGLETWISRFNQSSLTQFCPLLSVLSKAMYTGDWEYDENEYEAFIMRHRMYKNITVDDFKRTIDEIADKWTDLDWIMDVVKSFIDEFEKGYLEETEWYSQIGTTNDFKALTECLHLAKERDTREVRIWID